MARHAPNENETLKRGWTTGACATAATKAAYQALVTGDFPDPVSISLPKGGQATFCLAQEKLFEASALAGVIKDAGDDPDVTHGAMVISSVRKGAPGSGICFERGEGVGLVTKEGLPIPPGEPAINPVPRQMMQTAIQEVREEFGGPEDVVIEISVPSGEKLASKTWNPRLGIVGGISILGTTGVVVPFSCSAWIHSIHRGIDVARAQGLHHVAGSTGATSETAVQKHFGLPLIALLDMGDFAGGMLKYLRTHPIPRVTIGGGFAKLTKLAQGHLDLHSGRSQVDFEWLAEAAGQLGADRSVVDTVRNSNTAMEVLTLLARENVPIAEHVAINAKKTALEVLRTNDIAVDIVVVDRQGQIIAHAE